MLQPTIENLKKPISRQSAFRIFLTKVCIIFFYVLIQHPDIFAQNHQFFSINTPQARPLAMGGAFTAVEDGVSAAQYNPAGFSLYETAKSGLTFFLNPVAPIAGGIQHNELFAGSGSKVDDVLMSAGLLLKTIALSIGRVDVAFTPGEQLLALPDIFKNEKAFNVNGMRQNHRHGFVASIKLADQVSVGGAVDLIYGSKTLDPDERQADLGFSYGILLSPENGLRIGVSFMNLPDSLRHIRIPYERIVDESVNVGMSYELFPTTLLSVDLRNLGEEGETAIRELHFGLEQVFLSHFALRTGYFQIRKGEHSISWGLSLFDGNSIFRKTNALRYRDFFLNYAFVYQNAPIKTVTHFFSLNVRL